MRIRQLLERSTRVPVTVEYEQEFETSPGEWDTRVLNVHGSVEVLSDPYGTGDSPTSYEFEPDSITDVTGAVMPLTVISDEKAWSWIEDQAVRQAE